MASVLVTRAEPRNGPLTRLLRARGHVVTHWPAYRIVFLRSARLRDALRNARRYDWIVFSSPHAVRAVQNCGGRFRAVPPRVAAIGAGTRRAVETLGWRVHLSPAEANAESLAAALIGKGMTGKKILLPASAIALPTLGKRLTRAGAEVHSITAYRLQSMPELKITAAGQRAFDAVTFTSPSTIAGLRDRMGMRAFRHLLATTPVVAMGGTTAQALREIGVAPQALARPVTLEGLADSIKRISPPAQRARGGHGKKPLVRAT